MQKKLKNELGFQDVTWNLKLVVAVKKVQKYLLHKMG